MAGNYPRLWVARAEASAKTVRKFAWPDSISDEDYSPSPTAKNFLRFSNIPVAQDAVSIVSYRP